MPRTHRPSSRLPASRCGRLVSRSLPISALTVARGAIHAIVGPNGAGRPRCCLPSSVWCRSKGIVAHWDARGRIGYVPQRFHVDRTLPVTVGDFLALTRQRRPVCAGLSRSTRSHIDRLLDRVGLRGLAARPLSVLSGGELRRVLLAHALDPIPELLVLDEPAAGWTRKGFGGSNRRSSR